MTGIRLIYISRARSTVSPEALRDLADRAARRNASRNITGILIQLGNYFIQVLEGPEDVVMALFHTITDDSRHTQVRLLHKEATATPAFAQWSMGCLNLDAEYDVDLELYREMRERIRSITRDHMIAKECMVEILKTLPSLLASKTTADTKSVR